MRDPTDVERAFQDGMDMARKEGLAAGMPPVGADSRFCLDAQSLSLVPHGSERSVLEIKPEECPDGLSFSLIDNECSIFGVDLLPCMSAFIG